VPLGSPGCFTSPTTGGLILAWYVFGSGTGFWALARVAFPSAHSLSLAARSPAGMAIWFGPGRTPTRSVSTSQSVILAAAS
jgi:hypothetical protein